MPFHILPNEVVSEIFFQIEDRSTLYSLSLCSHRIHEIVEPVLYNVFEDTRPLDLVLFLRTILQNPRLGFHVRKFDARDRRFAILPAGRGRGALRTALPPVPQEPAFYFGCFEQDDWSRLCTAIRSVSAGIYEIGPWTDAIYRHDWEAVIALVLVLIPRLEHLCLELCGNYGQQSKYDERHYFWMTLVLSCGWGDMLRNPLAPVYLKYLKEVTITPYDTEMPISMKQLLPYLKVGTVTTFNMEFFEISEWERIDANVLPTKDITLSYAGLEPGAFRLFLSCFPNLERFSYEHDGVVASEYPLQPVLVGRALAHLKHCLRELILIDENPVTVDTLFTGSTGVDIRRDNVGPIGSLAGYANLEILDIMYHILITPYYEEDDDIRYMKSQSLVSALPSNIRSLTVRYCPEDFIAHIHELFDQIERFPRLANFTVAFDRSGPEVIISESSMRIFREESIKHGISLDLQYLHIVE